MCAWMAEPLQLRASSTCLLPVLLGLLEPRFPYLQNGYNYSIYFIGLLRRVKRKTPPGARPIMILWCHRGAMTAVTFGVIIMIRLILPFFEGPT